MTAAVARPGTIQIVIVNWNTGEYLRRCLRSIVAAADREDVKLTSVTVIDNASADGSADGLDDIELPLDLVKNDTNRGFAAACNQGAERADSDYVLFLNPDTRLLPDTLATVTAFMDSREAERVGICGVEVVEPDGEPAQSCSRFPTFRVVLGKVTGLAKVLPGWFPPHHVRPEEIRSSGFVDQVIGAFFFVRRDLFDRLGGFDAGYFVYYEEVDFALRARERGFGSYFLKEARVVHAEGISAAQVWDATLYHSMRSRFRYARLHWPRWQAALLVPLTYGIELPARLLAALLRRSRHDFAATLSAYRKLLRAPRAEGRPPESVAPFRRS